MKTYKQFKEKLSEANSVHTAKIKYKYHKDEDKRLLNKAAVHADDEEEAKAWNDDKKAEYHNTLKRKYFNKAWKHGKATKAAAKIAGIKD